MLIQNIFNIIAIALRLKRKTGNELCPWEECIRGQQLKTKIIDIIL